VAVTAETVKIVRQRTGAGILESKNALVESAGDIDKAIESLREQGIAKGVKLSGRRSANELNQGVVESYIHTGGRVGVLLELNCETDFVARTPEFKELVHNLAMQVAAMAPRYVDDAAVPDEDTVNPEEAFLMEQAFIKDPSRTIRDVVNDVTARVGENIRVRRFQRFALGDYLDVDAKG
jgi:elongation factor Ts